MVLRRDVCLMLFFCYVYPYIYGTF